MVGNTAIGDFDGDGLLDVAATSLATLYVLWEGVALRTYTWSGEGAGIFVADDFDADGIDELAAVHTDGDTGLSLVQFTSDRAWQIERLWVLEGLPLAVASGDLDADGTPEPVVEVVHLRASQAEDGSISLSVEDVTLATRLASSSVVDRTSLTTFPENSIPWPSHGLALADVTGDDIVDAVTTELSGYGRVVVRGNGDGTFTSLDPMPTALGPLRAADLDSNGVADLIAVTQGLDPSLWIEWNGGRE
jgi:hypothetical protein